MRVFAPGDEAMTSNEATATTSDDRGPEDKNNNSKEPTSTTTPLLKASLNSPPVAHANSTTPPPTPKSSTPTPSSVATPPRGDLGVDLTVQRPHQRDLYANLLQQLRKTSSGNQVTLSVLTPATSSVTRVSAAARKEKLRGSPSFQCPACKKRFQRHIALNAHFQNEHIGHGDSEKTCRLCSTSLRGGETIRNHLLREHRIDLETPTACLVEPDESSSAAVTVQLIKATSSTNEQAKDLSMKPAPKRPSSGELGEVKAKRQLSESVEGDEYSAYRCNNCAIVFPNQTLYFLHRGFHSETNPWRCNGCGQLCNDLYDFNAHLVSDAHG